MASGTNSDYIGSLSHLGGFDLGISFEGFGGNIKKFMELPIKYIDSTHDKAMEFVEDIHALVFDPPSGNDKPNEGAMELDEDIHALLCASLSHIDKPNENHGTLKDLCSNNVITISSTSSVKVELVDHNGEFSSPTSFSAEDSSMGSDDTDTHEAESFFQGADIEVNDQCMVPENTSITEIYDHCNYEETISLGKTASIKEEVFLCNSEKSAVSCTPEDPISLGRSASIGEEIILWNPEESVKQPQPPEPTTKLNDYVSNEVNIDKVMEHAELHSPGHPESSACNGAILLGKNSADGADQSELYNAKDTEKSTKHDDLSTVMPNASDDTITTSDEIMHFVDIDLRDDQEQMRYHKAELYPVPQPKNASFKKIFLRSMSNKLRWSKKDMNMQPFLPVRSQEAGNATSQAVASPDGLEDDWELL